MFFGLPGILGAYLARTRGKNPLLWGLISAPFPFAIFILWYHKPSRTVSGYFRQCTVCGEVSPWKLAACRYCGATFQRNENEPPPHTL